MKIIEKPDGVSFLPGEYNEILVELDSKGWTVTARGLRRFTESRDEAQAMLETELTGLLNEEGERRLVDTALDRLVSRQRRAGQCL